jgi:sugar phosphate permease
MAAATALPPAPAPPPAQSSSRARVLASYALISTHGLINHAIRSALPSLIPLIPGYTESQQALLLGAFFPGYICTQLPGGAATQRFGGKLVSTVNLWSNALLFLLTPLAARHGGAVAVAAVFAALGLAQGSYVPSSSVMIKAWLPTGVGRPWALRAMELGQRVGPLIAAWSVPVMVARWGWASVPRVYGSFGVLFALVWQLAAREGPLTTAGDAAAAAVSKAKAQVEWAVFGLAPVQVRHFFIISPRDF